jgi:TP901 family phage tail tape measure protein
LSDVNANIGIVFDTKDALASLRQLQAGLSKFNQSLTAGNVNAANAQKGLNAQLVQAINSTGKFVASQKNVLNSTNSFTDALEKNKLSMREYFRYTAAAATANTKILGRAFTAERDIINRARKDRVKALQTQYIQLTNSQGDLVKVLQVVPKHLDAVNGKYTDYATRVQMAAQRQQLMNQLLKQGSTQLLNFGKNTQWAGRQLMVGLTVPLSMLGGFAAQTFREMEKEVVNFKRVYGDMFSDAGATDKAIADIQRLGVEFTKYGIAVKDTVAMAAKAAAMGLTGSDLNAQVTAATRLSVLGQVEQQQALETTISLQNAFGISADKLAQKINFLNAVENQTVLSIEDLTIAVPKAGPVVKQLGGSVEDLAFFMTAMKEGGINASEGANALKSGLASLINPSTKASKFLGELGINIKGIVEANSGNLKGTVVGFAQALDTLDPLNRARAIEQLFGKFQFARLSTLFQNVTKDTSQASRALGLAGASVEELAILSERELGKVEDAVGVKFQKTIEQLKVQLIPVGKAFLEALTPVVAFFGKILEKFNNFSDGTKKAIAIVIGVVGGLAPIALMTFGLLANGLANLIKFFALLRGGMAKLNGQNAVLGGGFDYLTQQEIENLAQSNALHTSHQQLIQTFNVEVGSINALATAYANAASQARALAASSPGLFNAAPGAKGATSKLPKKFARGGVVPGTGNQDSVPSMLTPGEVVLTKDTVKANPELVAALMNGNIKKYGNGTGIEGNWASQIAARTASAGTNPVSIEASLTQDLAKVLKRATDRGIDTSQIEQRYKELVTNATQSLDELNAHTKASFQKLRDEALKPLLKDSGLTARYQQENSQYSHVGMSKNMPLSQVQSRTNITRPDVLEELKTVNAAYAANGMQSPTARVMGGAAVNMTGNINRVMAEGTKSGQANFVSNNGPVIDAFTKDWEKVGVEKWKATTDGLGITFDKVQAEFQQYDAQVLAKVKAWKAANPDGLFNDEVFAGIEQESRSQATETIRAIMESADNMLTAIRVSMTDAEAQMVAQYATDNGLPVPKVTKGSTGNRKILNAEKRTRGTAFGTSSATKAGQETGAAIVDGLRSRRGTDAKSPSRKGKAAGREVSEGVIQGMKESQAAVRAEGAKTGSAATDGVKQEVQSDSLSGGSVVDSYAPTFYPDGKLVSDAEGNPLPPRQAKKLVTKYNRGVRREKVGRYSGKAAGALGTASMVAGMAGAPAAVTGALGAGSMVASMAPALAGMGPVGWTIAGITAVGASLYLLDKSLKSAAEAQAKYINSVSASTEKMKKVGEITGKVGASEIMSKRRSGAMFDQYSRPRERKGQPFGETFLASEVGKGMQKSVTDNIMKVGSKKAAQQLSLELAAYISDGILDAEQANSIAQSIGTKLGDMTLAANIEGNLRSLVGPDGKDIFSDPIQGRLNIVAQYAQGAEEAIRAMNESRAKGNSGRTEAAQLAAISVKTVELAQAQADAVAKMYDDQTRLLEKELASTTNKEKQLEIETKLAALKEKSAGDEKRMNIQTDRYLQKALADFRLVQSSGNITADARREDAYFDSLKAQVIDKYKGTEQEDIAKNTMSRLAKISDNSQYRKQGFTSSASAQELEVQMNLMMANGLLSPQQSKTMLDLFDGDLQTLQTNLNIGVRTQGAAKTAALMNMFGNVEKKTAKTFIANIVRKNPAEYDKTLKTIDMLTKLDGIEINMDVALSKMGPGGLDRLSQSLAEIDALKSPITKEAIIELDGANIGDLASFTANYKDFEKLPDNIKKQALQLYTSIYSSLFLDKESRLMWAEQYARDKAIAGSNGGQQTYLYEYIYRTEMESFNALGAEGQSSKIATKQAEDYIKWQEKVTAAAGGKYDGGKGKGDNPLSFLDELAMRLKQVRDNAFNALKPIDSLLAAFTDKKTQKSAFKLFDGIQNRLLRMGVGKDLRDAVASMSAEDFAKVAAQKGKNAIFTFEKNKPRSKDTISGLAPLGKAADQGYRERNLGDYNFVQEETIKTVTDQATAYNMLIANGVSAARALEVVADAGQAAAIAGGAIKITDPEWKTYIKNINGANDALERQKVLNDAIKANQEFSDYSKMPELSKQLKEMGYSIDQIDTVLGNPELAKFLVEDLKDGKMDAKEIADYLNSIEARKIIDIQVALNKGDLAKAGAEGRQIVDELFAAQEGLIRTGPEAMKLKANERQIRDLESQIAPFRREIELINDQIEDAQRAIEENYSRPIEKLQEEVNDLNRELEMNPFFGDRAIKKIQDENNMLSNDLTVIAHAAEEVNKKYDEQADALSKVQEINANIMEQQKQQLDLADALTQGDISAAAQAAQTMRQTGASQFATGQADALEQARKNALGSLTGPQSGLTQEQINEKQYQNSQKIYQMETDPRRVEILNQIQIKQDAIYNLEEQREAALLKIRDLEDQIWKIEENSIEPLQERIDLLNYENRILQDSIDKQIESLTVLGKTRDEWNRINAQLDAQAAALKAANGSAALAGLLAAAETLNLTWAEILAKLAAYANGVPAAVVAAQGSIVGGPTPTPTPTPTPKSNATPEQIEALDKAIKGKDDGDTSSLGFNDGNSFSGDGDKGSTADAQAKSDALAKLNWITWDRNASGGLIKPKRFAVGGTVIGTDSVPAMLTPGEFVMSRYAVQSHGIDKMKSINNSSSVGDSVYNYSISVNVKSDANPDEIARSVMAQVRNVDSQRLRGTRI